MPEEWTSRKRVETALIHQEPDRVPLNMTITELPYIRLRERLGLPPEDNVKGDRFGEVQPSPDVLEALGIDVTFIKLGGPENRVSLEPLADGTTFDEWGVGRKRVSLPGGGSLLEVSYSPFQNLEPDDVNLDAYSWPDPFDPGRTRGLEVTAERLYKETDLALMGRFGGTILEQATFLRGYEQWLMDLVLNTNFARSLLEHIADIQIALDEVGIRAAGKYLSIFKLSGEDLGMQDRALFSPKMWRNVLRPVLKRRWQAARVALNRHGASHVKLMLHSDGAIRDFIPDLHEDGIDILDPIQIYCEGMEPEGLKRDFGAKIAFHGAIDTQKILPFGTPEEVEMEVVRCIDALSPGGGYILAPVHNVQLDVPPDNLIAMCRAAHQYGTYPLSKRG